jgi:hypothetical protein
MEILSQHSPGVTRSAHDMFFVDSYILFIMLAERFSDR